MKNNSQDIVFLADSAAVFARCDHPLLSVMRRFCLMVIFFAACIASQSICGAVTLAWDPSPDVQISGYKIYYEWDTGNGVQTAVVDVGNRTNFTFSQLPIGLVYRFTVTAYTAASALESPQSNQVAHSPPENSDADGDGLTDRDELVLHHSNPTVADTDGDGFDDGIEVASGFNPTSPTSTPDLQSAVLTAVEYRFHAPVGANYKIEASPDLLNWTEVEGYFPGAGGTISRFYSTEGQPRRFFRTRAAVLNPNPGTTIPDLLPNMRLAVEYRVYAARGASYVIESSVDGANWVQSGENIVGTGGVITRFHSGDGVPNRVFRSRRLALAGIPAPVPPDPVSSILPAVEYRFGTLAGQNYLIESSSDLLKWMPIEINITGTGGTGSRFYSTEGQVRRFYRTRLIGVGAGIGVSMPDWRPRMVLATEYRFFADAGALYRIESSADLINWTPVETNIMGAGREVSRFYSRQGDFVPFIRARRM